MHSANGPLSSALPAPEHSPAAPRRVADASTQKRPDIQGLRALAVLLVIVAHAGSGVFAGGFIGVDVFFVISGYLITSLLLREVERSGRVSIAGFYARRARRILPAAAVVTVAVLVWTTLTASAERVASVNTDARWSAVFLANFHFANVGTNYFADQTPSPFQHFWSLAVEEQFYLLWPLLIWVLAPRVSRRVLAAIMAGLGLLSLLWSMHITATNPTAAYFSSPARAEELAAGAVLATLIATPTVVGRRRRRAPWPMATLSLVGLAAIITCAVVMREGSAFPGWRVLVPVAGTVALLYAGRRRQLGANRLLAERPIRYIGDISYSLYLWHWPVLKLGMAQLPTWWPLPTLTLLVISFALAAASYRFIEQPFLRRRAGRSPLWRPLLLWPTTVATAFVVAAVGSAYVHHGVAQQQAAAEDWFQTHDVAQIEAAADPVVVPTITPAAQPSSRPASEQAPSPATTTPQRVSEVAKVNQSVAAALALADAGAPLPPSFDPYAVRDDKWNNSYSCYADYGDSVAPVCTYGDTKAKALVVIVGDSHAGHLLAALDRLGQHDHYRVVPLIKMGCAAYDVHQESDLLNYSECASFRQWTLGRLKALKPTAILTSSRGYLWVHQRNGVNTADQWRAGATATLTRFKRLAPVVRVFGDIPSRPAADDCLSRRGAKQKTCVASQNTPETASNAVTAAVAAKLKVPYMELTPLVCAKGRCPAVVGTVPVYTDNSHLSHTWGKRITPAVGELLGDAFPAAPE